MWRYMDVEIEFIDEEEMEQQQEEKAKQPSSLSPSQVAEGATEESEEDAEEGPPFYADEESTFIPLTWSTKTARSFYKGSDPEWQEFIKVAKDKSRHRQIQDELVQIVFTGSVGHPTISRQLGAQPKIGKYWLDISFPDGPPQEYERSGIEIGDGFVAWSQQRVSQEKQWRLMRALWPQAAAQGTWATVKVLGGIQWRRVKQMVGWEGVDPMSPEERWRLAAEMVAKSEGGGGERSRGIGKGLTDPDGSPGAVVRRSDASDAAASGAKERAGSASADDKKLSWLPSVPIPSASSTATANTDIPIAMHVFSHALSKSWNPKKMEPPRGTFVVQGLVEVRGQRGRMLFDVQSSYDPKAGKYVQVNAGVRNFKRWSQAPRGGP